MTSFVCAVARQNRQRDYSQSSKHVLYLYVDQCIALRQPYEIGRRRIKYLPERRSTTCPPARPRIALHLSCIQTDYRGTRRCREKCVLTDFLLSATFSGFSLLPYQKNDHEMRLPYAPSSPPASSPSSVTDTYSRIAARRHPRALIPLDLTLLHSPPVADGYNAFVGALRTQTVVPQSLLELAICRVAILTDAVYEWKHPRRTCSESRAASPGLEHRLAHAQGSSACRGRGRWTG